MQGKKRLAPLAVLAGAALALSACGSSSNSSSGNNSAAPRPTGGASTQPVADGGTLVYGADQEQSGFNDLTAKDNSTASGNIMENVWPFASKGQPNLSFAFDPNLFSSAPTEIKTSPQTIEYKINPKAVWSDGVPIDVSDFKFNWQAQNGTDKGYQPASTAGYSSIQSVEQGSGGTKDVIVTFKTPYSDWQGLFAPLAPYHTTLALAKKSYGGSLSKAWNDGFDKSPQVSGGPYEVQDYVAGDHLDLVPNPMWWGPKPHLQKITFRYLTSSVTQPQALSNGEVGMIYPQPQLDEVAQIDKLSNIATELNFGLSFEHIDFNIKTPGLDDLQVRKAISTAINVPAIVARTVAQFSNKATQSGNSVFVNNQQGYVNHIPAGETKGDTAASDKILTADGYAKDSSGYYAKGGKELSFDFSTTSGNALRQQTATLFQSQMKAAGIKINLVFQPASAYFTNLAAHKFEICLFAWVNTPFPAQGPIQLYATDAISAGSNFGQWSDPTIDKLAVSIPMATDRTTENNQLNQVDQQLWSNAFTIPLFQKPTYIAYDKKYVNIHDNPTNDGPFWNSYTWGIKAS